MDFFKQQASSFLSSKDEEKQHGAPKQEGHAAPKQEGHAAAGEPKKSEGEGVDYQELMGSATVLLDAAKSRFGGTKEAAAQSTPADKAKLADAAEDVLRAASQYGHLEGTQYEGYVKKAEDYLQSYKGKDFPAGEAKRGAAEGERDPKFEEGPKNRATKEEYPRE